MIEELTSIAAAGRGQNPLIVFAGSAAAIAILYGGISVCRWSWRKITKKDPTKPPPLP